MKQIKLKSFLAFKDHVLPASDDKKFEGDCSLREIMEMKNLLLSKAAGKQQFLKPADNEDIVRSEVDFSQIPSDDIIDDFGTLLDRMQGKDVFYVLRNLLRLLTETRFAVFLTSQSAACAFKMYTAVLKSSKEDDKPSLRTEAMEQFASLQVVLTIFELSLFNKEVIKQTKSGPIMTLRSQLYNYFECNEERVLFLARKQFARIQQSNQVLSSLNIFLVRLFYCMMYYAFEIKSDMA